MKRTKNIQDFNLNLSQVFFNTWGSNFVAQRKVAQAGGAWRTPRSGNFVQRTTVRRQFGDLVGRAAPRWTWRRTRGRSRQIQPGAVTIS